MNMTQLKIPAHFENQSLSDSKIEWLNNIFKDVIKKHFPHGVKSSVKWGLPPATETVRSKRPSLDRDTHRQLSSELVEEITLVNQGKSDLSKIESLAKRGLEEAVEYLVGTAKTRSQAQSYKKMLSHDFIYNRVPAGCSITTKDEITGETYKVIILHQLLASHLKKRRIAPRYVIYYLLFHEILHEIIPPVDGDPHPKSFRAIEAGCPDREKAVEWLSNNEYAVLDD